VTAASALLIVEVADTSLGYDLGTKAGIYARLGLAELWVINANTLFTTIHRKPEPAGCRHPRGGPKRYGRADAGPQLAVRLGALDLA
jgi:Uma2 family endonuclease